MFSMLHAISWPRSVFDYTESIIAVTETCFFLFTVNASFGLM